MKCDCGLSSVVGPHVPQRRTIFYVACAHIHNGLSPARYHLILALPATIFACCPSHTHVLAHRHPFMKLTISFLRVSCLLPNTFIFTHAGPFATIWAHPCPYVPSLCAAVFLGFPSVTDHHTYTYCDLLCLTLLCCCDPPYFRPPLDSSDPSAPTHDPPCSFVCVCNTMYDFFIKKKFEYVKIINIFVFH